MCMYLLSFCQYLHTTCQNLSAFTSIIYSIHTEFMHFILRHFYLNWVHIPTHTCTYRDQPVPKAYRKCCVEFRTTPSVRSLRTGFPAVIQHSLSENSNCRDSKTWNDPTSANLLFYRAQNALCGKTGRAIIGLLVSKQDGTSISHFWCRNQKMWGKRIFRLKSTGKRKSRIMDGVWWSMISNPPIDVMCQNRHIPPSRITL